MFRSVIVPVALACSALANVYITSPVSNTTFTAGQPATITWIDDGGQPSLAAFGNATFAIYVGNSVKQTALQTIATYIDVATVAAVTFTPNGTIGPNSNQYFIRATSQTDGNGKYYAEAFSAQFTMAGMTGAFNATELSDISGQSTAPLWQATAPPSATTTSTSPLSSPVSTSGLPTNAAGKPMTATGFVALAAALVGASLF